MYSLLRVNRGNISGFNSLNLPPFSQLNLHISIEIDIMLETGIYSEKINS